MVGTKITRPVDGWHKNNSPKGLTYGELDGLGTKITCQRMEN